MINYNIIKIYIIYFIIYLFIIFYYIIYLLHNYLKFHCYFNCCCCVTNDECYFKIEIKLTNYLIILYILT